MRTALALMMLLAIASAASAQPNGTPASAPPPDAAMNPAPVAAARLTANVSIDGSLDEEPWRTIAPATVFFASDPIEWAPPSQLSEVRVAYDDAALYIGARLWDTAPDSIMATLARRDSDVPSDYFTMYLDPNRDLRSGYYFSITPAGMLLDGTLSNDGAMDNSWDGVWEGRAKRDDKGWTVEMRIPLSQLRYTSGAQPVWGINFSRDIKRHSEKVYLIHRPKNASGFVSRFPPLEGLRDLRPSRTIELLPYVTSKAEFLQHAELDPFNDGSRLGGAVGGDLRMSVGTRLTLNATVNPDFGQVEIDPAQVNLSDAETYFSEKRPFFVEGSSAFRFGNEGANSYWNFNWPEPTFFYSRRIGRGPECSPPDAEYSSTPLGTTILGAAKMTGKIGPTWNFGTLHALTSRETAKLANSGVHTTADVEPLSYYGIARGLHEFKDRRYGFGMLGSTVIRNLDAPQFETQLNRQAFVGGVDGWAFLDPKKMWVLSGWSAMSHVRGSKEDIAALQTNPRHYFQRPDAPQVKFDPNATSLTGIGTRLWLNKQEGDIYSNSGIGFINPGFDVNDMGYMRSTDVINAHAAIGKRWTKAGKLRKQQNLHTALFGSWDFDGEMTWGGGFVEGSTEFRNNYSTNYEFAYNPQTVNDRATRGGPRILNMPGYEYSIYFDTDSKSKLFYSLSAYSYFQPDADSWNYGVYPGVTIKPASNINVSIGPGYEKSMDTSAFVDIYEDALATNTFGSRYVFADNDQTTLSANLRLNWAMSPRLSLQFFGQPYFTTAAYTNYKELAKGRSYDFNVYGQNGSTFDATTFTADPDGAGPAAPIEIGNRSFNYRSMRGNAVLRWEYMPGSTLFLVWTQQREDVEDIGDFALRRSARQLFDAHPDNVFLAKLTYYLTP